MLETTKTTIKRITETEGVKYEIYIPIPDTTPILIYLDETSFLSLMETLREAFENVGKKVNVNE
ncbi:hypothetical protein LEP1GSC188_4892 [Leptospira weilii serovar Topaz str. LT2116]|uniref:Uncharacterized protein n=1 Tax=Leptospira weilii serovar Topaz str. LT2116 TaxID=1088540 RepID=M3FI03_9LEPT|nr:hypothetical protein LEP1GSC188_4852 [Leptospira weilii serovar Topaz str. LT2116]EMF81326.1 hypothetical protein LEP1GSC188_4895 [Leptospira weilii serovar Topaz str. LT2116]EMF84135.1 hypothetical protein LEP1GSC188_4892 [Leptospira weilii serovar Topaz str. LT2116]